MSRKHPISGYTHSPVKHWRLDYGWARRGGKWTDFTDVMLEARVNGDSKSIQALRNWVDSHDTCNGILDGVQKTVFYAGGIQGYAVFDTVLSAGGHTSASVYMHSHGQDAFDSLCYYSKQLASALNHARGACTLEWVEHAHQRSDHLLVWP